jgi:hypothetical protein
MARRLLSKTRFDLQVKNLILVDCDLGFVFWLGRALDKAGYETFPARSIRDAIKLVTELRLSVWMVILNPSLAGASEFIANLRPSKVIALVERGDPVSIPGVHCEIPRPYGIDEHNKDEFLAAVRRLLGPTGLDPEHSVV